jgi:hypothetical protein
MRNVWAPPSNYSVKRTPVNRFRHSKRCGRRRLPQALDLRRRVHCFMFKSRRAKSLACVVQQGGLLHFKPRGAQFAPVGRLQVATAGFQAT